MPFPQFSILIILLICLKLNSEEALPIDRFDRVVVSNAPLPVPSWFTTSLSHTQGHSLWMLQTPRLAKPPHPWPPWLRWLLRMQHPHPASHIWASVSWRLILIFSFFWSLAYLSFTILLICTFPLCIISPNFSPVANYNPTDSNVV